MLHRCADRGRYVLEQRRPVPGRGPLAAEPHGEFAYRMFAIWLSTARVNRDELGYDGAEPGSPDYNIRFGFPTYSYNLPSDVFTLSITVSPNHQGVRTACFVHQISFYFLVLGWYERVYWGIKEGEGITGLPLAVSIRKIMSKQVT